MDSKLILYNSYNSSCSWRVRIALNLKGIDYVYKSVNLHTSEQFNAEYERLNPCHQVPALVVDDNQVIVESIAIIEYLEDKYGPTDGHQSLLPTDLVLRAKARAIAMTVAAGIQPLQNDSVVERVGKIAANNSTDPESAAKSWSQYWIQTRFKSLETILTATSGQCCVGDSVTIADVCLVPQVFNALNLGIDIESQFPTIAKINAHLLTLDAFKRTHPYKQPDCPTK